MQHHLESYVMQEPEFSRIEIGVVLAGRLDTVDREAIDLAVETASDQLRQWFPNFEWKFHPAVRDEWTEAAYLEPTELLQQAREERDERVWDFVFVITAADLVSHYKPFALSVVSRALDGSVISTARVDPRATNPEASDAERLDEMRRAVLRLMLHTLGHWLSLGHHPDRNNVMYDIESVDDLPKGVDFTNEQRTSMRRALETIADQRLEERADIKGSRSATFAILAAWENRWEILDAVVQARPWQFPLRLGRLSAAAISTVLLLLMTAETWDMATSQSWITVVILSVVSITLTTGYVALRQQLLLRRNDRRISEQIVTSNVSAAAIVACGMMVMFALLCGLTLVADLLLFPHAVVESWAASQRSSLRFEHSLLMAGTVGSLGLMIGALGASFEQLPYFRHVVFVDEEV